MKPETIIAEALRALVPPDPHQDLISTKYILYSLLTRQEHTEGDHAVLAVLAKKIDVSGKVYAFYTPDWKRAGDEILQYPWMELLILLFYQRFRSAVDAYAQPAVLVKLANTILKALDISGEGLHQVTRNNISIRKEVLSCLDFTANPPGPSSDFTNDVLPRMLREIPLTVLFYEGPVGRAYLQCMYSLGVKPKRIVQLISSVDISTRKPVAAFLPGFLRKRVASFNQRLRIFYWVNHIDKTYPGLRRSLLQSVESALHFDDKILDGAYENRRLSYYSDRVDTLMIRDLKDEAITACLLHSPELPVLFTGGGILPSSLLSRTALKFIHIHPGFLPAIRGADCFLWSNLLWGCPSASCFYMKPGIDMGNIIFSSWLPPVLLPPDADQYDTRMLYRAIYSFIDPWVRAAVLREMIASVNDYMHMPAVQQQENEGVTYHYMHPDLQRLSFKRFTRFHQEL